MKPVFYQLLISCAVIATIACQANPAEPALLVTKADQAIVATAIAKAVAAPKVTLADDAFLFSSQISFINGKAMGRDLRKPDHFVLMQQNQQCYLQHKENNNKVMLPDVKCKTK